jgi:hypothetical protein
MYLSLSFLDSLKGIVMFLLQLSELCLDLSPLSLSFFTVLLNGPQVLVLVSVDHSPELIPILSKLLNSDLLAFNDLLGFEALLLALLELVLLDSHI